jgi:long-chain acyl-CoA synthetase
MPSQAQAYPWVSTYPDMLDWNLDIPVHPVYDLLDATAQKFADRPAFDFLGKQYTWAEISDLVDKFAAGLQRDGLEKGMKVGLFLPNSPYFLISYYAVLKAGGTVVHFNPLYAEAELSHQIEDSETEIMITCDLKMLHEKMEKMLHATRLNKIVFCKFTDVLPFPKNVLLRLLRMWT